MKEKVFKKLREQAFEAFRAIKVLRETGEAEAIDVKRAEIIFMAALGAECECKEDKKEILRSDNVVFVDFKAKR